MVLEKTTLLKILIDYLEYNTHREIICTAPTNEAVRVISKMTGKKYDKTIYSLLGLALEEFDDGPAQLVVRGKSKLEGCDILAIDEASMISEELFDIIQNELDLFSYVKIIYIGDDAQLPPVQDEGKNIESI